MFEMLFTVTFFTGFIILLRCVCKNHISAGLRYAIWFLVAVKLLVFPMPKIEGNFSVLGLVADGGDRSFTTEEISEEALQEAEGNGFASENRQRDAGSNGNPGNTGGVNGAGAMISGTDTGTASEYVDIEGKWGLGSGRWFQIMGLRLQRYIQNVWKAPMWSVLIWGTGSVVCALWMAVYHFRLGSYLRKKRVMLATGPFAVYSVEGLPTPCLFGKSIYIPAGLAEDEKLLSYALKHERCHYAHGDHIWGLVRMICVCLYWYHPLVWLAAYLSRQDCELACDASAVRHMKWEDRKRYGELLLAFALVKGSPADCFAMTTAMSGNAGDLKERLCRITEQKSRKKSRIILGTGVGMLGIAGICACVTSGFVSPEKQWQRIKIWQQEGSIPMLQESYEVEYRLSKDAVSYGCYVEQYEYGELVSAEVLDCAALQPEGGAERKIKKGEALFSRAVETDEVTGGCIKSANSYSIQDYSAEGTDGASSAFKAFTVNLPVGSIGNSFSFSSAEKLNHRFRLNEDIILAADYYGDGRLEVPGGHTFTAEEYMEAAEEVLKNDRCVILTHLVVSDKTSEELEKQLEELVKNKEEETAAGITGADI